mmetsp:Transcript_14127/g.57433  ORF Transcript_14127/g.57433 Transcript_14127/m.57433 type:complete len:283 (-) Transcript_14127:278-1126(-)
MTIRPPRRTSCSSRRSGRWAKPCASGPRSGSPAANSPRRDRGKGTPSRRARDRTPSRSRRAASSCSRPPRRRRLQTRRVTSQIPTARSRTHPHAFVPPTCATYPIKGVPSKAPRRDPRVPRVPPQAHPWRSCASRSSPSAGAATPTASAATTRPKRSSNRSASPRGRRRRVRRRRWRGSTTRTIPTRRRQRRASRTATGYSPIGSCGRLGSGARTRRRRGRRRRRRATSGGGDMEATRRKIVCRMTRRMTRRMIVCRTKGTGWLTSRGAAAFSRLSFTSATA